MQLRRHMPPLRDWRLPWPRRLAHLPPITREQAIRWAFWLVVAGVFGYTIAALFVFPTPLFPHRQLVPRVLGMPVAEARQALTAAHLVAVDQARDPDPTAPAGTVTWQDPPPGVEAPSNLRVALTVSAGPPRVPVPDVTGLDGTLARKLVAAAGFTVSRVESVQAAVPAGLVMLTRPAPATALVPGSRIGLVVSRGAPTITVPGLLGLTPVDARTRLEAAGLRVGGVTRRRTADAAPGTIVEQRPGAGTLAAPETRVDLIVARSPS
jgi:eukaryotic-like serine/threonine-protein kinase